MLICFAPVFTRRMKINVNQILRKSAISTLKTNPYNLLLNRGRTKTPSRAQLQDLPESRTGFPAPHCSELREAVCPAVPHSTVLPSPVHNDAKPLPPTGPACHQGLLGEQALPCPCPGGCRLGIPHSQLFPPKAVTYCLPKVALPCIPNLDPACNFFFFCLSLELPAWLSLHRTGREAPAKRAIPAVMCRRLSASSCKGSLSMLRLKRQQSSRRRSLSSHQNKLHLSPHFCPLKDLKSLQGHSRKAHFSPHMLAMSHIHILLHREFEMLYLFWLLLALFCTLYKDLRCPAGFSPPVLQSHCSCSKHTLILSSR